MLTPVKNLRQMLAEVNAQLPIARKSSIDPKASDRMRILLSRQLGKLRNHKAMLEQQIRVQLTHESVPDDEELEVAEDVESGEIGELQSQDYLPKGDNE